MTKTTHFELVSPEKKLMSEPVYMAVIPGDEGVMGVMGGHCSLLSSLRTGVVKIYKSEGGDITKIFIAGGFADITPESCTVLAEEALNVHDFNQESLEQDLRDLNEDMGLAAEKQDKERVREKIRLVEAKLRAIAA